IAAALATLQQKVGKPSAESLAELAMHAYPATELGAGASGDGAADEPVPGREG
ncbi:1-acyl-sn-glycerol-3-phosphate acyltransferase, partial [Burkholderia pyrrocinia]|nr:1-acyl-sn-glycerol-3-phosphate acyltransferase [Burkholderia pyrrocinia]